MAERPPQPAADPRPDAGPASALFAAWAACPVVAIYRGREPFDAPALCHALYAGGVRAVEITLNTPGARDAIRAVRASLPGGTSGGDSGGASGMIGAGTVLDADAAKRAVDAGAQFLVAPAVDEPTIRWAADAAPGGVPILPGAFTPTEVLRAWRAGATAVKVFPADALGPGYIRGILAPLDGVRVVPTGNLALEDVPAYLDAGATAVGVGPTLIDPDAVRRGDWDALTDAARRWTAAVQRPPSG